MLTNFSLATLRNKKKLATLNKQIFEENLRNKLAQSTSVAKSQEGNFTQVSEELEEIITKKLSEELKRTESRILFALALLDELLLNPPLRCLSGSVPDTSRNALNINQGTNKDDSQDDAHPEIRVSQSKKNTNFWPLWFL